MEDINRHIEIDNYLNGNLSVEERAAFENKMNNDLSLKHEVEAFKLANDAIKLGAQVDIKSKLQNIHNNHLKVQKRKKWGYGGVVLLIVIVVLAVIFNPFSEKKEQIKNNLIADEVHTESRIDDSIENKQENSSNEHKTNTKQPIINLEDSSENLIENIDTVVENNTEESNLITKTNNQNENIENSVNEGENEKNTAAKSDKEAIESLCEKVNKITPKYKVKWPCLGHEQGSFELLSSSNNAINFTEYSLDGGKSYNSIFETKVIGKGGYNLIVKDEQGCTTNPKKITVKYRNCNFVIQPPYGKFLELNLTEYIDYPVTIEIRNARSAQLVYTKNINPLESFIWEGKDQSNSDLPLGNYVYFFISETEGLIAQGQITIVN